MNPIIVQNRIQPKIVGLCEVAVTLVMFALLMTEYPTQWRSEEGVQFIKGLLAVGVLFLAAVLHCASILLLRVEISPYSLTVRSWQTHFLRRTVEAEELSPVRFVSGGPARTPLLVLRRGRRKLAKISAFCTNADRLESWLRGYEKWSEE